MKKKMTYFAPETETLEVRMEARFLDSTFSSSTVETASYSEVDWQ